VVLTLTSIVFNVSIAATVFAYGLHARWADVRFVLHRPRLLTMSLIALFVVTPALALAIVLTLDVPLAVQVAVVALALSPIPPLLPQKEMGAGGDPSYAIGLVVAVAVLAPVVVPALVDLLGRIMDRPYGVAASEVSGVIVTAVVVPLLAGMLVRRVWPRAAAAIRGPAVRVAGVALTVATLVLLVITAPQVWEIVDGWTLLAMFLFNAGALAVGHLLAGPPRSRSVVLALSCASRHPAIALSIATANYPGRNFAAAVILCLVVNAAVVGPYLRWQGGEPVEPAAEAA
jgi:BASS family bile acid:Na+ symporter